LSATPFSRKQLAIRRLLLDGRGHLNADARILVQDMRKFCRADGSAQVIFSPVSGSIDVNATLVAAARREVFERYVRMLLLDVGELVNLREEN